MSTTAVTDHACRICDAAALHEIERFRNLPRVTSDSRPWSAGGRLAVCHACGAVQKLADPSWLDDIDRIYRSYAIYHQAGGREQPIFSGNGRPPEARSVSLLRYLGDRRQLPARACVLDFGCGTGAALHTFAVHYPEWKLYGAELSTQSLALLQKIPGFVELFTCPPNDIPRDFDLITLFHALEHVLNPVSTLRDLSGRLDEHGVMFVQVPDGTRTPYDLIIADHLLHFSLETLKFASQCAGIEIIELTDAVLPKELSLVARGLSSPSPSLVRPNPGPAIEHVDHQVNWLFAQIQSATTLAQSSPRFGVFGTSISATWLAGLLGDKVAFFVDEDEERIGRQHMGRPILAADAIADNSDIFVPLIPNVAASVVQRLSRPGVRFQAPPPIRHQGADHEISKLC